MRHPAFADGMFLLRAGVPYRLAFGDERPLSAARRMAMNVWLGEFEGGKYNWNTRKWEKPKT